MSANGAGGSLCLGNVAAGAAHLPATGSEAETVMSVVRIFDIPSPYRPVELELIYGAQCCDSVWINSRVR